MTSRGTLPHALDNCINEIDELCARAAESQLIADKVTQLLGHFGECSETRSLLIVCPSVITPMFLQSLTKLMLSRAWIPGRASYVYC
jgi:hypothetical protein